MDAVNIKEKIKSNWIKHVLAISIICNIVIASLFISGCMSMAKKGDNEPELCFQNRYCITGVIKAKGKDFSGCLASYGSYCRKKVIKDECKNTDKLAENACLLYYN